MYIGDYLARRCVYDADAIALVDAGRSPRVRFTYRELNDRANRLANWLRAAGIGPGDRVAMLAEDRIAFYDAFFACAKLGAVLLPLNWRLHPVELRDQLRLTEPRILFHGSAPPVAAAIGELRATGGVPRWLGLDDPAEGLDRILEASSPAPVTCDDVTERDTACLLFTGGTTGRPKAAQISHGQIVWNTFNTRFGDIRETDVFVNVFPLFHAGGLFAFSVPLLILGGRVVQTARFDPERILELIADEAVTIFGGVPTMFQMLADCPAWLEAELTSLRFCISGGAPMPVALIRRYRREKGVVFRQGFGMTEFGPGVFSLRAADAERKAGSIGKPNFFVDARIVDPESDRILRPGEVGELRLRGPVATTGYFRDPEATARAFDAPGFLRTGDLAYVDEEGDYFIVDRLKDMFISGGENVFPAEVEAVLYGHPAVALCAVVGVPDPRWGEVGRAYVVLREGHDTGPGELMDHMRRQLAAYKVPKSIVFRTALPLTGAGKVLKRELRTEAAADG